jgi:hypothetical protein
MQMFDEHIAGFRTSALGEFLDVQRLALIDQQAVGGDG